MDRRLRHLLLVLGALLALAAPGPAAASSCGAPSAYSNAVTGTSGLVGYWRLGEASGTAACDSSSANGTGAYQGGFLLGTPGALAGDPNTATTLNGSTGWVRVPDSSALDVGDNFSVEAWVKRGSTGGTANQVVASKQAGAWVLMFSPANELVLRQSGVDDVAYSKSGSGLSDTTAWHYVAATKTGSSIHLYIDGTDVTGYVSNLTMSNNTNPLAIGQSSGSAWFKGGVDEVAVYNRVLSASEVAGHYQAGKTSGQPPPPPPPSSTDPVIAAAGDIACDPTDSDFNGGLGTAQYCRQMATSNLLVNQGFAAVLPLGDLQYENGTLSAFRAAYAPSWGRVKTITRPVTGNHEYQTNNAAGYFDYFNGAGIANGPAGDRSKGFYSYNVGNWHLIALNSNCWDGAMQGCGAGSPEETWLRADLAAHPTACTLAYWHHPRWNSSWTGNDTSMSQIWKDLYAANADVVLNGHAHDYERFAPQDPNGNSDTARGIREIVAGTGGEDHHAITKAIANSQVRNTSTYGILQLTLHPTSYDWRFVPEAGQTFTDSGTANCH